jgi:UDPglucose 6-dehydrogenase
MTQGARRIIVVGAGYVGLVTAVGLASKGHRVEVVETRPDRLAALRVGRSPVHEAGLSEALASTLDRGRLTVADHPGLDADVVMICVGTPIGPNGRSDLAELDLALRSLDTIMADGLPVVVRSTLPPGSTRLVAEWTGLPTSRIFTNPEFLRQGTALEDFLHPTRIVIGRFHDADSEAIDTVTSVFSSFDAPVLIVDVAAAELIKNGANAFLALKLSFANELAGLAEEYGTDIDQVIAGIGLDPRIGDKYLRPGLGFGGSCLPKELVALAVAGEDCGLPMHVTRAASEANAAQQLRFTDRIDALVGGVGGLTVALLGLAFKAGTDDVRDSPALGVARELLARGARVRGFDPAASANARREVPELETVESARAALDGADVAVIATDWPEYRDIDWLAVKSLMRRPLVVDGRRMLDAELMARIGYSYEAVGSAPANAPGPVPLAGAASSRDARG